VTPHPRKPEHLHGGAPPTAVRGAAYRLALAVCLPLGALALLRWFGVPLGCPGRFVYLYSPIAAYRLQAVPTTLVIAAVLAAGVGLLARAGVGRQTPRTGPGYGLGLVASGLAALAFWSYGAPPQYFNQHFFNIYSPSQDGAFNIEALKVTNVRDYLARFPQRAQTPPAEMRGTRVISNPPGTTLLAVAVDRFLRDRPALADAVAAPIREEAARNPQLAEALYPTAVGVVFFYVLTALWALAAAPLYALGRLYFAPAVAAVYALVCVCTPATLMFTPGKDPAQLLTTAVPLALWLLALRRARWWAAAAAGAAGVLATAVSLVHVWLAAIVLVASLAAVRGAPGELRRVLLRGVLPATVAALATALLLAFGASLNLCATAAAVARAQATVTRGAGAMPLAWQALGVPLFLLFIGPGAWACLLWTVGSGTEGRARDADARFGRWLLLGTGIVLLATIGFTNVETPRLWIPFVPLLVLGAMLQIGFLRPAGPTPARGLAWLLAALVGVQVAASALHWSLTDMRETETRLTEQRFFH
jgi:hypothetical protein